MILQAIFWILLLILIYTFVGYAFVLFVLLKIKKIFFPKQILNFDAAYEPDICLFVTAFNEKDYVNQKVANSFSLDYPQEKIQYLWITDGSDDGTPELLKI
ncbi:MAG: hypothetical protein IPF54_09590 [Draconibacterium sp.]|nr:hypothetical protein [Draconibacterium sp.]